MAAAISLGGPGATFWMILIGLCGMATKFVEATLGVKYRYIDEDGIVHGGPFQYLKVAFGKLPQPVVAVITGIFAFAIIAFGIGGGGMYQTNQTMTQAQAVSTQYFSGTALEDFFTSTAGALIFGIIFAFLVGLVIIGGIRSIGKVTSRLVPAMAIIYVVGALIVILVNITEVPNAIGIIITGAFNPEGIAGGILGVIIMGAQRAAFSNEVSIGSAPIAHSAAKTRRPASEGFVASLEPFIDTVVVCTMTALVIIIGMQNPAFNEMHAEGEQVGSVADTSAAFATVMGWFPIVLLLCVALFAFSSIVTWAYYGAGVAPRVRQVAGEGQHLPGARPGVRGARLFDQLRLHPGVRRRGTVPLHLHQRRRPGGAGAEGQGRGQAVRGRPQGRPPARGPGSAGGQHARLILSTAAQGAVSSPRLPLCEETKGARRPFACRRMGA